MGRVPDDLLGSLGGTRYTRRSEGVGTGGFTRADDPYRKLSYWTSLARRARFIPILDTGLEYRC